MDEEPGRQRVRDVSHDLFGADYRLEIGAALHAGEPVTAGQYGHGNQFSDPTT